MFGNVNDIHKKIPTQKNMQAKNESLYPQIGLTECQIEAGLGYGGATKIFDFFPLKNWLILVGLDKKNDSKQLWINKFLEW